MGVANKTSPIEMDHMLTMGCCSQKPSTPGDSRDTGAMVQRPVAAPANILEQLEQRDLLKSQAGQHKSSKSFK
ncbi:Hypothetical predicted protein, partial [Pelobates cultripes]